MHAGFCNQGLIYSYNIFSQYKFLSHSYRQSLQNYFSKAVSPDVICQRSYDFCTLSQL